MYASTSTDRREVGLPAADAVLPAADAAVVAALPAADAVVAALPAADADVVAALPAADADVVADLPAVVTHRWPHLRTVVPTAKERPRGRSNMDMNISMFAPPSVRRRTPAQAHDGFMLRIIL